MRPKLTGGSLTLSIAAVAIAWTVRSLREQRRRRVSPRAGPADSSKFFAELSLEALALLVHLQAGPYCFIDVRPPDAAAAAPLAPWVTPAVNIPEPQLTTALKQPAAWYSFATAATPSSSTASRVDPASNDTQQLQQQQQQQVLPLPTRRHLLILVTDNNSNNSQEDQQQQQQLAVSRAAAAGFDRVAVPSCGIEQLLHVTLLAGSENSSSTTQQVVAAAAAAAAQLPAIHADALAVLSGMVSLPDGVWQVLCQQNPGMGGNPLQQQGLATPSAPAHHSRSNSGSGAALAAAAGGALEAAGDGTAAAAGLSRQRLLLLDVRRHDERTLYGAIAGAHHVPADELASALRLSPAAFKRRHHFEPPARQLDVCVLQSRAASRAQWAAQICLDAGCKYVFVYPQGVVGWEFSAGVDAYAAYQQGDKPPEPEARVLREPDVAAGVMELQQLGLVPLLMQQHGVTTVRS